MTWIKICGTTNAEDAGAAVEAGADALGFVFAPSPRRIEPERAREITAEIPPPIEKIGVFANEFAERICEIVEQVGLTAVQLHGTESLAFARELRSELSRNGGEAKIIRAMKPPADSDGSATGGLGAVASSIFERDEATQQIRPGPFAAALIDSAAGLQRGGTGRKFDWNVSRLFIPVMNTYLKVVVAGGLTPGNVGEAIATLRPWGVDVCSGVEREPGRKDHGKLRAFVEAVRAVDRL